MDFLRAIWNWITGKPDIVELPSNIFFEKDVSSENDFWISCILDPTLEIKYVNGIVTKLLDTDKCLINDIYHYQPKTDREIRNFPYIEVNNHVRVSMYRKKNSNDEWKVASCVLSKNGSHNQANRLAAHKSVHVESEEPPVENDDTDNNNNNDDEEENSNVTIEVIGEMPKIIGFEQVSTVQILFRNNSYVEKQEVLDYYTTVGSKSQLSIVTKPKLPIILDVQSQYIFEINLEGKFLGRSTEKVEFVFKDIIYKVGIQIEVVDSRIIIPLDTKGFTRHQVDMKALLDIQNETFVPGIRPGKKSQFNRVKIGQWNISPELMKCFWTDDGKSNFQIHEIKEKVQDLYPAAFESLCYQNYKQKFHILLFMEEIEITIALQKYAKERIHFEQCGEYLSLKIPDLAEQRPSLVCGDFVAVTDPPNCTKLLGEIGRYEGIIHKVTADSLLLKFDPEFHNKCGNWDFSVTFFLSRTLYRRQHEIIEAVWKKKSLGEEFLFPYKESMEYQPPKIIMKCENDEEQENEQGNDDDNNQNKNKMLPQPKVIQEIKWFNQKLNLEQKCAVINILKGESRPMPYVIFGPPGTGKTITLTEAIIQVYKEVHKSKLLVCAPTNSAADLLLIKLVETGLFDTNIMKRLVGYNYFSTSNYTEEIEKYCFLPDTENAVNYNSSSEVKTINRNDVLKLKLIITTAGSASMLYMMGIPSGTFTHIFVDEAGQMTEPEILLPIYTLRDGQVIMAGDPKQLGPVVLSTLAKRSGLGQSMLARFIHYPSYKRDVDLFPHNNGYNPRVITHLIRNYRSLPEIVDVFNKLFYDSLLTANKLSDNVPEKIMVNSVNENAHWNINCKGPVIVHGIKGEDFQEPSSPSWFNPHEAFQVLLYTTKLLKAGISGEDIGIITPYSAQVWKINELLRTYHPEITLPKVGTVEMFQGQERMVIIISIVRSKSKIGSEKDDKFGLGFVGSKERINVSLSRAKALLIIIGNPTNMLANSYWKKVLNQAKANTNYIGCNVTEWTD